MDHPVYFSPMSHLGPTIGVKFAHIYFCRFGKYQMPERVPCAHKASAVLRTTPGSGLYQGGRYGWSAIAEANSKQHEAPFLSIYLMSGGRHQNKHFESINIGRNLSLFQDSEC